MGYWISGAGLWGDTHDSEMSTVVPDGLVGLQNTGPSTDVSLDPRLSLHSTKSCVVGQRRGDWLGKVAICSISAAEIWWMTEMLSPKSHLMLPCVAVKKGRRWYTGMPHVIRPTILHFSSKAAEVCNHHLRHELAETLHLGTWNWLIQSDLVDALSWRSRNLIFWEVSHINAAIIGPSKLQVTRKRLLLPSDFDAAEAIERNSLHTDPRSFLFVYMFF